jgi:DNA adenine methylase
MTGRHPRQTEKGSHHSDNPFPGSAILAANVASVPQRSPLRYPGGKTWLIPHIRAWLSRIPPYPLLVEPFAGGGIVSLTAVMERLVERALMVDLDRDIAAFWRAALCHGSDLAERVQRFTPTRDRIEKLARQAPHNVIEHGFRTLVLNRTRRGGVLAPGASLIRKGENGHGVTSRWYPETLGKRLAEIAAYAERITFCEADGLCLLEDVAIHRADACFFIDPPYTAGGKRAGSRLYAHNTVDHVKLFELMASSRADFLMTYDCSEEIVSLVRAHDFHAAVVVMKNNHHARMPELVITRDRMFT